MTLDIKTIEPSLLKAELLRLRNEEHMDFLENLIGMDWGEEGGLGVVYMLLSTSTGKRANLRCSTTDRVNPVLPTASDLLLHILPGGKNMKQKQTVYLRK